MLTVSVPLFTSTPYDVALGAEQFTGRFETATDPVPSETETPVAV